MSVNIFDLRVKEDATPYLKKVSSTKKAEVTVSDGDAAAKIFCDVFSADKLLEEHVWELCLDAKCHPVALFEVSHGSMNSAAVSPDGIFRRALLSSAARIIIAHNHPSGELSPSTLDMQITKQIANAGKILNIPLIDHLIIGRHGMFYSFMEHENI